jgi:membrane protein DedA with SNARE-associated domain
MAGFTPIPYKIFTIASGVFQLNFLLFLLASTISRSLRFFLVAGLFKKFGPSIQVFIDKYFNLLAVAFFVLLLGGFLVIKYLF